jgi:hypothetical protein
MDSKSNVISGPAAKWSEDECADALERLRESWGSVIMDFQIEGRVNFGIAILENCFPPYPSHFRFNCADACQ